MIDLKSKIVFVHIPKCAGTSIEQYFMQIRGLDFRNRDRARRRSPTERGATVEPRRRRCARMGLQGHRMHPD